MSVTENVVSEEVKVSALDELLSDRDTRKSDVSDEDHINPPIKEKLEQKPSKETKNIENKENLKENIKNIENKDSEKKILENKEEDEDDRELELGKLRKALNDSQKWGHTNNKRLKSVVKIINSLKEQEILNEEEFNNLSTLLSSDSEPPEIEDEKTAVSPLDRFINAANKRMVDLRDMYDGDPLFDKKVNAFDFFFNHASEQEKDDLLEELEGIDINSLKLPKKLFQIGEKYYEENYKELDEAGGLKELITVKNTEIKRMQRKIDKLEKELSQYNDFDKPNLRIDELGDTFTENSSTDEPGNVLGSVIKERDNRRR